MRDQIKSISLRLAAGRRSDRHLKMLATYALLAVAVGSCTSSTGPGDRPPAVPARLEVVAGEGQEGVVGTELANPVVARVLDDQGNPIANQLVNFRVASGNGSVFAGSALTNSAGVAQERWTLGTVAADSQRLEVRAVDGTSGAALVFGVFHAVAHVGAPDTVRIVSGGEQSVSVTAALTDSLLVRVVDRYGNPVPGVTVTWTADAGAGTFSRSTDVTTATGYASTKLTAGTQPKDYHVTAATGGRSSTFLTHVTVGSPASLVIVAGNTQSATVGTTVAIDPTVCVTDAVGNPVPGTMVSFAIVYDGTILSSSTVAANDSGIASISWTLTNYTGRLNTINVSVPGLPPVVFTATGVAEAPVIVNKNFAGYGPLPLGTVISPGPAVLVTDRFGNPVAGMHVIFAPSVGSGSVTSADVITDPNGQAASGSWTLGTVRGIDSVTATVGALPPVTFYVFAVNQSPDVFVSIPSVRTYVSGNNLNIFAYVSSANSALVSVDAIVGTTHKSLTIVSTDGYAVGTLSLLGMPRGPLQLMVAARNANGAETDAFWGFQY